MQEFQEPFGLPGIKQLDAVKFVLRARFLFLNMFESSVEISRSLYSTLQLQLMYQYNSLVMPLFIDTEKLDKMYDINLLIMMHSGHEFAAWVR